MAFEDVALVDFPVRLWKLDGTSPFVDLTGSGATATTASTAYHAALIKGARRSILVGNTNKLSVNAPIMKRGHEDQPFSIEVTALPVRKEDSIAEQQIFGTASAMDGLTIAGTVLAFSTKYTNTGQARCEYDLQEYRAATIIATHTATKNSIFVDGELVAEVEITPEQQADTYLTAGTSLTSGTTSSTNLLALNGLTIYTYALGELDATEHYEEASDNMDEFTVGSAYGASVFALNSSNSMPLFEYTYNTDEDWSMGRLAGATTEYGQLTSQAIGTTSIAGRWEIIVPLPPESTLSSITMSWEGKGVIVETSLDGSSWSRERRSARISTVSDGFVTTDKTLFVRVSFSGGIENDESYFDDLVITGYGPVTTVAPSLETRSLTLQSGSIEEDHDITEYHENWGVELNDGTLSLSGASETATSPKTIQVWIKKGLTGTLSDSMVSSATNWYTNDGTYQQLYQVDEWQLRTYTFSGGYADPITITGTGQIGCILIYPNVLTPEQIAETYTAFTGTKSLTLTTSGTIGLVDLTSAVDIYEYDWAIESAG